MVDEKEYLCDCGHAYGFHNYRCILVKDGNICKCEITLDQLISKEIKAERERILKEWPCYWRDERTDKRPCVEMRLNKLEMCFCCRKKKALETKIELEK